MSPAGFEPAIPAIKWLETDAYRRHSHWESATEFVTERILIKLIIYLLSWLISCYSKVPP
jgi:hypothetical protein